MDPQPTPSDSLRRSNPVLPNFRPDLLQHRPSTSSLTSSQSLDSETFPPLSATSTKSAPVSKILLPGTQTTQNQTHGTSPLSSSTTPTPTPTTTTKNHALSMSSFPTRPKSQSYSNSQSMNPHKGTKSKTKADSSDLEKDKADYLATDSAPTDEINHQNHHNLSSSNPDSPTRLHLVRDSHMSIIDSKDEHDVADVVNYLMSYQNGVDKSRRNHSHHVQQRKACYTPTSTGTAKSDFDSSLFSQENHHAKGALHSASPTPPIILASDADSHQSYSYNHNQNHNQIFIVSPPSGKARDFDKSAEYERAHKETQGHSPPRGNSRNRNRAKRNTDSRQSTRSASPGYFSGASSRSPSRDGRTPVHQKYTLACIRGASPIMAGSSSPNRPFVAQWSTLTGVRRHADPVELDPIIFMLNSAHLYMQKQGISMLHTLSVDEENHANMIGSDVVPAVLQLASSPDPEIQKDASNTLAYLSKNDEVLVKIAESNGIQILIRLLSDFELRVRTLVLTGLKTLAQTEAYADRIIEDGGLDPIIRIIKGKFVELRRIGAETLSILCGYRPTSFKIVHRGLLSELASITRSKDLYVRIDGIRALARLLHQSPHKFIPMVMEKDLHLVCMENLQKCSRGGEEDELYLASLQAVFEFSCDDKATALFLEKRIYEILVEGTRNRNMDVLRESIRVFSAITSQESFNKILVQDSKTLCSLINLGYANNLLIKKSIAKIFRRLVNANHQKVLHQLSATTCLFNFARVQDNEIMIDVSLALGGILQFDFIPVEERPLEFQKMVRLGLIETLSVLSEIEHRDSRCTLSSIISRLCDYVQDFDRSTPLLLHAISKLFGTPEIFIVSNLTHSVYVLSLAGTYNRAIIEMGLLGFLKKYSITRNLEPNIMEEGSKAIETLSKDFSEIKGPGHERDRARAHSVFAKGPKVNLL